MKCRSDADVKRVGIEWSIAQTKELIAQRAPCVHFYTMGRSEAVRSIVGAVY